MTSASEVYAFHLQNEEPSFYSRIPHILSYLTYDYIDPKTQEKSVMRLSVHARELYRLIKQIAGDTGKCWANRNTLAEMANMSVGSISSAKWELSQSFHQLDGNPLISIKKTCKRTVVESHAVNGTVYDTVLILNIWKWNNAFMQTRSLHLESVHNPEARSTGDSADEARSTGDSACLGARSTGDTNKNPVLTPQMSIKQQPEASASDVAFKPTKKRNFPSEKTKEAYEWMRRKECPEPLSYTIATSYVFEDIQQASIYVKKQIDKKKRPINEIWAYFQTTLKNRYWEKAV